MSMDYRQMNITCPMCGAIKIINVPAVIFEQKKFGNIKIQVPIGAVCSEHQFIVFADTKANVQGYEKIDLYMSTPSEKTVKEQAGVITLRVLMTMFGTYGVFSLIHAKIMNYPVYILLDKDSIIASVDINLLNMIGDNLLPEAYKGGNRISFIEEIDYDRVKIKEKKSLIMDSHQHILQTPWDEKLKFEEAMIKEAFEKSGELEQLNSMQQAIAILINEAEQAKKILENTRQIVEEELIEAISNNLMEGKISNFRLQLIKHFISQRFSPKLSSKIKSKVEDFLGLL